MNAADRLFEEFPPVSLGEWEKVIEKDLQGADYKKKLKWYTNEGINALPFYRKDDQDTWPSPLSVNQNEWEVCQPIIEKTIQKANNAARQAVENGADALDFALHIQHPEGELGGGLQGTAIQDQASFSRLLGHIDLTQASLHFDSGVVSPIILAMLHNSIESQNLNPLQIGGSVLYDPYAFITSNGQLPKNEGHFLDEALQMTEFCASRLPGIKCLGINAHVYHNSGGTLVQELGYALAIGSEYLTKLGENGLETDLIASAIHFNFSIGSTYFLEIARFRAARKLWRKILDVYNVKTDQKAYLHASSSRWNKTLYAPYVNMLRTTTEGMSAAIAGCDAITIHPFDETFQNPDDFSQRIARNSQIILKEETYFNKVADPGAGSYYIEVLTDKIAKAAWHCFREIEQQGGMLQSIRNGYIQTAIEKSRRIRDEAIAKRGRIFVGTNQYPNQDDRAPAPSSIKQKVTPLKKSKHDAHIEPDRLMASLTHALQNGCTVGDLVPSLIDLKQEDIRPIQSYRGPQAFEELRQATENNDSTPQVLMLPLGDKKMRKVRSAFAVNFFGCAGYDITDPIGFESIDEAISKIKNHHPDIVVLCSSDDEYKQLVPELCGKLNELNKKPIIVLTGYPKEYIEQYKNTGVDVYIHSKSNVLEALKEFQQKLGITED